MSHSISAAHDPSVADYRATSPRCAQGGTSDYFFVPSSITLIRTGQYSLE